MRGSSAPTARCRRCSTGLRSGAVQPRLRHRPHPRRRHRARAARQHRHALPVIDLQSRELEGQADHQGRRACRQIRGPRLGRRCDQPAGRHHPGQGRPRQEQGSAPLHRQQAGRLETRAPGPDGLLHLHHRGGRGTGARGRADRLLEHRPLCADAGPDLYGQRGLVERQPDLAFRFLSALKASADEIMAGPIAPIYARAVKDYDIPHARGSTCWRMSRRQSWSACGCRGERKTCCATSPNCSSTGRVMPVNRDRRCRRPDAALHQCDHRSGAEGLST